MFLRTFLHEPGSCASYLFGCGTAAAKVGALVAGGGADVTSPEAAIVAVAVLTAASGFAVAATRWQQLRPRLA